MERELNRTPEYVKKLEHRIHAQRVNLRFLWNWIDRSAKGRRSYISAIVQQMNDFLDTLGALPGQCDGFGLTVYGRMQQYLDVRKKKHQEIKQLLEIIDKPPPEYDINDGGWNNDGAIASRVHQVKCNGWREEVNAAKRRLMTITREMVA